MKLCRGLWYFEDVCCPWTAERRQSIPFDGALLTSGYNYLLWPWTICGNLDTTGSWWRKTEFIRDEIAVTEVSSPSLPPTPKRRPGDPFWSIKTLILCLVPFFFLYVCIWSYLRAVRRRHSSEIDLSNRSRDLPELKTMICKQTLTYCHVPVDQRNEITSRSYSNKTKRSKLNSFKRHRTRKSRWRTFWFCVWFVSHDDCMLMAGVFSLSGVSIYKVIIFSN